MWGTRQVIVFVRVIQILKCERNCSVPQVRIGTGSGTSVRAVEDLDVCRTGM